MPVELSHINHPEYLEIFLDGNRIPGNELEETTAYWKRIFEISQKLGQRRILVLARIKGRFPVIAQVEISFRIKEIGCTHEHRIAAVAYSEETFIKAYLIEKLMLNWGYKTRLFRNKEKAKSWLLQRKQKSVLQKILGSFL